MPWRETAAELARARAERPMVIPTPAGALYGIFTPPDPGVPPTGRCAVLFTRPRLHRNRMWVEAARRLATAGFACFRFDYHGTGDSEGASAFLDPNQPYQQDAIAVLRHLREHAGQTRFVVSGLCFDARTALSAFEAEGDAIDGLVFIAAPVMELDAMAVANADRRSWRTVGAALLDRDKWRTLATPGRWTHVGRILGRMAGRSFARGERDERLSATFVRHLHALARSRARALFLYGAEDMEYRSFQVAERSLLPRLPAAVRARFDVEVWPGVVHSGTQNVARQREILDRATRWILALEPAARGARATAGHRPGESTWTSA
jgi:alpha/beta superfamily hydrolase